MEENIKTPINFVEIFNKLWAHRKLYYKVLPATLIITYLIMACIPRYYRCTVSLAPEHYGSPMTGSLSSLVSAGLGSSFARMGSSGSGDALNVEIYPDILQSNDFIAELMTVEVTNMKGTVKTNFYTYLRDHQKAAWWDIVKATIGEWIKPTPKDGYSGEEKISVFNLTQQQSDIFSSVRKSIRCSVDKKTDVVSIIVQDQDPLICATMANATCKKLQEFIVNYRTNKAHIDYEYYTKLTAEAKAAYVKARQQYVTYADANQEVMLASYKAKEEDLENEMQLKYNVYNSMTSQKQSAAAKLQEATPAFTIIQSATVPYKPAGPKRVIISIAMTILASFVLTGWLLIKGVR